MFIIPSTIPGWDALHSPAYGSVRALLFRFLEKPCMLTPVHTDCGVDLLNDLVAICENPSQVTTVSLQEVLRGARRTHPDVSHVLQHDISLSLRRSVADSIGSALRRYTQREHVVNGSPVEAVASAITVIANENLEYLQNEYSPLVFNATGDSLMPPIQDVLGTHCRIMLSEKPALADRTAPFVRRLLAGNWPLGYTRQGTFVTLTV